MATAFSTHESYKNRYIIDERVIRRIFIILNEVSEGYTKVKIDVTYSNRHSLKFDSVDDFFNDLTTDAQRINDISIAGYGLDSLYGVVTIDNNSDSKPIRISVSGKKDKALKLKNDLEDILNSCKSPLSSIIKGRNTFWSFLGSLVIPGGWPFLMSGVFEIRSIPILLIGPVMWFVIVPGIYALFPTVEIQAGKEGKLNNIRSSARNVVFGVVILGLIVGVIGGILTNILSPMILNTPSNGAN
jgi:hypothetical protein